MKLRGVGLFAVVVGAALTFGCSPSLGKGGGAASPSDASAIPSTREAEDQVGTTYLTSASLPAPKRKLILPAVHWDHWESEADVADDADDGWLQTWGASEEPPYEGPVGKYGF